MTVSMFKRRWLWVVTLTTLLALTVAACGSDPTATPEPTATPTPPTATPVPPTATPAPVSPTEAPDSEEEPTAMNPLEKLVITPATTGRELFGSLSEEETNCIKTNIGEGFFELMMDVPIAQASADPAAAAPIFGCVKEDNLILMGVAFMDAQAGGWSDSTRQCVAEVGKRHPDSIYLRLGLTSEGMPTGTPGETHLYNLEIYDCMTNPEKKAFNLALWLGVDRNATATGADIVGLLSDVEIACVTETLSAEEMTAVAAATPLEAVTIANRASHCIDPATDVEIFVMGIQWGLGELSEDSATCLRQFAKDNPQYVGLVQGGIDNMLAMDPDEFVALTDSGLGQYDCMTEEEIQQIQITFTEAASGGAQ